MTNTSPMIISHRGNINGKTSEENSVNYIRKALEHQFIDSVEIDVWFYNNSWWLGHDKPTYEINFDFIFHPRLLIHTKNLEAFSKLTKESIHYFWHQDDEYTLTSFSIPIVHPKAKSIPDAIIMDHDLSIFSKQDYLNSYAICTDNVIELKRKLEEME